MVDVKIKDQEAFSPRSRGDLGGTDGPGTFSLVSNKNSFFRFDSKKNGTVAAPFFPQSRADGADGEWAYASFPKPIGPVPHTPPESRLLGPKQVQQRRGPPPPPQGPPPTTSSSSSQPGQTAVVEDQLRPTTWRRTQFQ